MVTYLWPSSAPTLTFTSSGRVWQHAPARSKPRNKDKQADQESRYRWQRRAQSGAWKSPTTSVPTTPYPPPPHSIMPAPEEIGRGRSWRRRVRIGHVVPYDALGCPPWVRSGPPLFYSIGNFNDTKRMDGSWDCGSCRLDCVLVLFSSRSVVCGDGGFLLLSFWFF
jgi:hypothetical protein